MPFVNSGRVTNSPYEPPIPPGNSPPERPTVCRLARQYQPLAKCIRPAVHAIVTWNRENSEPE